jgi:WD40 repeat protein
MCGSGTPYFSIYKRTEDMFTLLPSPADIPDSWAYGISFSPNANYLAVGSIAPPSGTYPSGTTFTYLRVYKRSGDTFTKLPDLPSSPSYNVVNVSFSPTGTYLAVNNQANPTLAIYKRSGDNFTLVYSQNNKGGNFVWTVNDAHLISQGNVFKRTGDSFVELTSISLVGGWMDYISVTGSGGTPS